VRQLRCCHRFAFGTRSHGTRSTEVARSVPEPKADGPTAGGKLTLDMLFIALAAGAYLLGSIPNGYLLMRFFRQQDIRALGSGNIGATNVLRSGSKGLGAATFLLDMLKGVAAVLLAAHFAASFIPGLVATDAKAIAALFAVLGHFFPVWLGFRGGKGVSTGFGVFLAISPLSALSAITVFAILLGISRYVSLASIVGAASFPLFAWKIMPEAHYSRLFLAVVVAVPLLIIAKHHQNIARLIAGTESRIGARKTA